MRMQTLIKNWLDLVNEIEPLGYTFDYYLDAEPYGLRPIEVELTELEGWENIND